MLGPNAEELQRQLAKAHDDIRRLQQEVDAQRRDLELRESQLRDRDQQISQMDLELRELRERSKELSGKIGLLTRERPRMGVEDVARQLREEVERVNAEATRRGREGETAFAVDQFEVELRAGVTLEGGLKVAEIPPQELSAGTVSTIRMTFRPAATLKIAESE